MTLIHINEVEALCSKAFMVIETHDDGDGRMLAEFATRPQALTYAIDCAGRYDVALHSAEIVHLTTWGDAA